MNPPTYKFIVIGSSGVGKTAIIKRLTENSFDEKIQPTIGVEYDSKIIQCNGQKVKLQIWDTAGQERFRSVSKAYYRNAVGVLIVYDITDRKSFDDLSGWVNEVHQLSDPNAVVHLVGNKSDLDSQREVSMSEAVSFSDGHKIKYIETSAKGGDNIKEAFIRATADIISKGLTTTTPPGSASSSVEFKEIPQEEKAGCQC